MAKHIVKCKFCGVSFDESLEPAVKIKNRYAHKLCAERAEAALEKEQDDFAILLDYIKQLYGYEEVPKVIFQQINQFVKDYNYTHSGILKTLKYFYEIKHNDIEKSKGRISIVPYIYDDAKRYYYAIWEAQQQNTDKDLEQYAEAPKKEIHIISPKRNPMGRKRNLFSFLNKEEDEQ